MLMDVAAYVLARLLLAAVLTAVIFGAAHLIGIAEFPLVVALLFAIVVALPLGIWVFAPLRQAGDGQHRRVRRTAPHATASSSARGCAATSRRRNDES